MHVLIYDQVSGRTGQRPQKTRCGRQHIHDDKRGLSDAENVVVYLTARRDGAVDLLAKAENHALERRNGDILDILDRKRVIAIIINVGRALDGKHVLPIQMKANTVFVATAGILRSKDEFTVRTEQTPTRVIVCKRLIPVEIDDVTRRSGEPEQPAFVPRRQGATLPGVIGDGSGRVESQQAEGEIACSLGIPVYDQRVIARNQVDRGIAADPVGIRGVHGPVANNTALRPLQRPADIASIGQTVENRTHGLVDRKRIDVTLPGLRQGAIDRRVERQHLGLIDHLDQLERKTGRAGCVDAPFEQQQVLARLAELEYVPVGKSGLPEYTDAVRPVQTEGEIVARIPLAVEENPLPGSRIEAVHLGRMRRTIDQRTVEAVTGAVYGSTAQGLVEAPVPNQPRLVTLQCLGVVRRYLLGGARGTPQADIVELSLP